MALETDAGQLASRLAALRETEPDPFTATAEEVEAFVIAVRELVETADHLGGATLTGTQERYLEEAAMRQVRFARARLETDRHAAIEILERLFKLGSLARPNGRYDGELIGLSTGLLSDPFFEWLTRIYLPWLGKSFDSAAATGDNVFTDNAWSKATGKFGWPEYRKLSDDPPGTVRVFPFKTYAGPGIEDPEIQVLKIAYADAPNPLPVRRIVDEVVELPGGYILGKAHMRGLREFRRVCFFGLTKAASES